MTTKLCLLAELHVSLITPKRDCGNAVLFVNMDHIADMSSKGKTRLPVVDFVEAGASADWPPEEFGAASSSHSIPEAQFVCKEPCLPGGCPPMSLALTV